MSSNANEPAPAPEKVTEAEVNWIDRQLERIDELLSELRENYSPPELKRDPQKPV